MQKINVIVIEVIIIINASSSYTPYDRLSQQQLGFWLNNSKQTWVILSCNSY